jgi:F-type H+-transporting ATPase subunit delta
MRISKQARRHAKQLFRSCLRDQVLDEARVRAVVTAVAEERPRAYLQVLSHFARLLRLEVDRRTARVESAVALTAAQQATVMSILHRLHGPQLRLTFRQEPALVGGLRLRVGSDVYDGSIQTRLARLADAF